MKPKIMRRRQMRKPIKRDCSLHGKSEWPFNEIAGGWICSVCVRHGMYNYNVVSQVLAFEGMADERRGQNKQVDRDNDTRVF